MDEDIGDEGNSKKTPAITLKSKGIYKASIKCRFIT